LMAQYVNNKFYKQYKATIGADFMTKEIVIDDTVVTLQIWDTAGQERFQSLGVSFYRGADCVMCVYDVNSAKSFESLENWRNEFLVQASPSDTEKFPVVVVGNKIDVEDGKDSKRVISEKKAKSWCTSKGGLMHFECSAKEDINVDAAFEAVARFAVQNEDAEEDVYLPDTVSIDTRGAAPSSGCC